MQLESPGRSQALLALLLMAAPLASAQGPAQASDARAFSQANKIEDPAARVVALAAFLKQNPESDTAPSAAGSLIAAGVAAWPKDTAKVVLLGDDALAGSTGWIRAQMALQIGSSLLRAKVAAADAVRFARLGVDSFSFEDFKKAQERRATGRNGARTSDTELQQRFAVARAGSLDTLGRTLLEDGKGQEAKRSLEEALKLDPYLSEPARKLADLAGKTGDTGAELLRVAQAYLAHPTKTDRERLEGIYKKAHADSLEGLDVLLDEKYESLLPNPAHLDAYTGTAKHTVLAELLTGSGCPPCVGIDLAFDALLERYPKADVTFLYYHQNRPKPDPMTNPYSMARFDYYEAKGVPTLAIDGKAATGGGGQEEASMFAARFAGQIDAALEKDAAANLELTAARKARTISVHVELGGLAASASHLKLHLVVAEGRIRYSGESGIRFHPLVVRSEIDVPIESTSSQAIDREFNLDKIAAELKAYHDAFEKHDDRFNTDGTFRWPDRLERIDADHLSVVAFLQDDTSKAVLQSISVPVARATGGVE